MSIRPYRNIERRKSRKIKVGNILVGGDAPISVQTMTNTLTTDINGTIKQIEKSAEAGADIIRVSCPDKESTIALRQIVKLSPIPIIADIHYHYLRAVEAADAGAACLRINPGNIGNVDKVKEVINAAKVNDVSIRIGVNAGSLEKKILEKYGEPTPEALVESALNHIQILKDHDFDQYKISVKASDVFLAVAAYTQLADIVDCPLHIGITEAGSLRSGTIKSAIGLGNLLWAGIGDTIRVSLSAEPYEEVKAGYEILKSLGLRRRGVTVISCPSCARQQFDVIRTVQEVEERLEHITESITVSIIGCIVNGPGEARETDIGLTGGGKGSHQIYVNGITDHIIRNENVADYIVDFVQDKISQRNIS
ncbi:MAG: flavodoxin-dependent (E)-4-hydroxy-3-methylbut-2-enyl-diphosphate synthase [Candidatus Puniceispirillales bacterium]|jgi:(E)-4-hydroxy-3-methylbut-2-enyl-diphosphate synthase|tara:strand:+ start:4216 stop:5313 length:1098 start_codon:yes stop_codon:yes gene_type:complete